MPIEQHFKYGESLSSFNLGKVLASILKPGRYAGYDNVYDTNSDNSLNLTVSHLPTRTIGTRNSNNVPESRGGVFISQTGQVYRDKALNFEISLDPEISGNVRYDYLIATVSYSTNPAGNNPVYSIQKDINISDEFNNGGSIWVPDAANSVILGMFILQPNASTWDAVEYIPNYDTIFSSGDQFNVIWETVIERRLTRYFEDNRPWIREVLELDSPSTNVTFTMNNDRQGKHISIITYGGSIGGKATFDYLSAASLTLNQKTEFFHFGEVNFQIEATNIKIPTGKIAEPRAINSTVYAEVKLISGIRYVIVSGDLADAP